MAGRLIRASDVITRWLGEAADTVMGNTWDTTVSLFAAIRKLYANDLIGSRFTISKTITDKTTITESGLLLTGVSSVGELVLENITIQNDSTVTGGNVGGTLVYSDETIPLNLAIGGAAVIAASGCISANPNVILAVGKKIGIKAVSGDVTGDGSLKVFMTFRRNANGATIAAA
jgi:hypothetical protein